MKNLKQFLKNGELNSEELDEATTKALDEVFNNDDSTIKQMKNRLIEVLKYEPCNLLLCMPDAQHNASTQFCNINNKPYFTIYMDINTKTEYLIKTFYTDDFIYDYTYEFIYYMILLQYLFPDIYYSLKSRRLFYCSSWFDMIDRFESACNSLCFKFCIEDSVRCANRAKYLVYYKKLIEKQLKSNNSLKIFPARIKSNPYSGPSDSTTILYQSLDDANSSHYNVEDYKNVDELGDYALQNMYTNTINLLNTKIERINKRVFYGSMATTLILPKCIKYIDREAFVDSNIKYLVVKDTIFDNFSENGIKSYFKLESEIKIEFSGEKHYNLDKIVENMESLLDIEITFDYINSVESDNSKLLQTLTDFFELLKIEDNPDNYVLKHIDYLKNLKLHFSNTLIDQLDFTTLDEQQLIKYTYFNYMEQLDRYNQSIMYYFSKIFPTNYNYFVKNCKLNCIYEYDEKTDKKYVTLVAKLNDYEHQLELNNFNNTELYKMMMINDFKYMLALVCLFPHYGESINAKELIKFDEVRGSIINKIKLDFNVYHKSYYEFKQRKTERIEELIVDKFNKIEFVDPRLHYYTVDYINKNDDNNELCAISSGSMIEAMMYETKLNTITEIDYKHIYQLECYAFEYIYKIKTIDLSSTNIKYIQSYAFTRTCEIEEIILPKNVQYIDPKAFYGRVHNDIVDKNPNIGTIDARGTIYNYAMDESEFRSHFSLADKTYVKLNDYPKETRCKKIIVNFIDNVVEKDAHYFEIFANEDNQNEYINELTKNYGFITYLTNCGTNLDYVKSYINRVFISKIQDLYDLYVLLMNLLKLNKNNEFKSVDGKINQKIESEMKFDVKEIERKTTISPSKTAVDTNTLNYKILTQQAIKKIDMKQIETYIKTINTNELIVLQLDVNYNDYTKLIDIYEKNHKFIEIRPLPTLIIEQSTKQNVIKTTGYKSVFFNCPIGTNNCVKEINVESDTFVFETSKVMRKYNGNLVESGLDIGKFTSLKKIDMSKSSVKCVRLSMFNNTHNLYILLPKCLKYLDACDPVKHLTSLCILLNKEDCNFTNLTLDFTYSSKYNGLSINEIAHITDLDRFDNVNIINNSVKFNFGLYINL